ncbi:PIR Superfamily Protein [Plasmodium ovale wallikeri]|uniref:PIR Superfamily Protein n=1 Tax=Plasmodium ovale wallikeri TaxID=864142 RepID=A0A1A8ZKP3_PLAOA|nr:PIR Superfamily Protein [Plasmodium ovale wallikeri]SBT44457.1 PIR Superfamily Protein [Plasmodium ovale wallikeri]
MTVECNEIPDLPSCKIQEQFNRKKDGSSLSDECTQMKNRLVNYKGIEYLCSELERNLKDLCTKEYNDDFFIYRVEYLHYWLLEKAIKTFNIKNSGGFQGILSQFLQKWNSFIEASTYTEKCVPLLSVFSSIPLKDFESTKDMYNYYYNYKYLEMNNDSMESKRKESCKHLSSMLPQYAKLKNLCSEDTNKVCSLVFKSSIDEYDPEILRKQVECNKYELDNTGLVERSVQEKPEGIISPSGAKSEDEESSGLGTSVHYPETSNSAMRVGFPLFGFLIIGFILLKFTPIRSWFYNRMIKKGKLAENLDEEASNELSNHYFETEELKSQGKGFSISYNTLQNIE